MKKKLILILPIIFIAMVFYLYYTSRPLEISQILSNDELEKQVISTNETPHAHDMFNALEPLEGHFINITTLPEDAEFKGSKTYINGNFERTDWVDDELFIKREVLLLDIGNFDYVENYSVCVAEERGIEPSDVDIKDNVELSEKLGISVKEVEYLCEEYTVKEIVIYSELHINIVRMATITEKYQDYVKVIDDLISGIELYQIDSTVVIGGQKFND